MPSIPSPAGPNQAEPDPDWAWSRRQVGWVPPATDTTRPSVARIYDHALGGKNSQEIDREIARAVEKAVPDFRAVALANRGFVERAVSHLAQRGITQFLDLGSGLPNSPSVHEVAQQHCGDAKVVYVDNDPVVLAHSRALLRDRNVLALQRDLRDPRSVLDDPGVRALIDFERPVAVLFAAVLHLVALDRAPAVVRRYRRGLAPGSALAMSMACREGMDDESLAAVERIYTSVSPSFVFRSRVQIEELFEGTELLPPGLVGLDEWQPAGDTPPRPHKALCGVGLVG